MKALLRRDVLIFILGCVTIASVGICVLSFVRYADDGSSSAPSPLAENVIPWVDSTEGPDITSSPAPTVDASIVGVRQCIAADLYGEEMNENGAGGWIQVSFRLTNRSASSCRLLGTPSLRFLDSEGYDVGTAFVAAKCYLGQSDPCGPAAAILEPYVSQTPVGGSQIAPGQSYFGVMFWGRTGDIPSYTPCARQPARLAVGLPEGGGDVLISDVPINPCMSVSVFPFGPAPTPSNSPDLEAGLRIDLHLPDQAIAGETLHYTVDITNTSDTPRAFFSPCPNYNAFFGLHVGAGFRALNCEPIGSLAPEETATLAMELAIPVDTVGGTYPFLWTYWDGHQAIPAGGYSVDLGGGYTITVISDVTASPTRSATEQCPNPTQPCRSPD